MTELEMFNNLLSKDPNPGEKNRVIRIDNYYKVPGWVFDKEDEYVNISYKNIKSRGVIKYNLTGQIIYDILVLGLTNIEQRPKCPICGSPAKYDCFSRGYYSTCKSKECISKLAKQEVLNLWKNEDYRNTQSQSHKEWASIEENKKRMSEYSKKNWENKEYRKTQTESHVRWASIKENREKMREISVNLWKTDEFRRKMENRSMTTTHGSIQCSKASEIMTYDSLWEKDFIEFCDNTNEIISIKRADFYIEYKDESGINRMYFPDFIVSLESKVLLVEVKSDWFFNENERTKLKIDAGYKYVLNNNDIDDYIVLLGDDIYTNKSHKNIDYNKLSIKLGII